MQVFTGGSNNIDAFDFVQGKSQGREAKKMFKNSVWVMRGSTVVLSAQQFQFPLSLSGNMKRSSQIYYLIDYIERKIQIQENLFSRQTWCHPSERQSFVLHPYLTVSFARPRALKFK